MVYFIIICSFLRSIVFLSNWLVEVIYAAVTYNIELTPIPLVEVNADDRNELYLSNKWHILLCTQKFPY